MLAHLAGCYDGYGLGICAVSSQMPLLPWGYRTALPYAAWAVCWRLPGPLQPGCWCSARRSDHHLQSGPGAAAVRYRRAPRRGRSAAAANDRSSVLGELRPRSEARSQHRSIKQRPAQSRACRIRILVIRAKICHEDT